MSHTQLPVSEVIPEAVYWRDYYEQPEPSYEWNNGYLEEKPVSDFETAQIYRWFLSVLEHYLKTNPIATVALLEMGFRLQLPHKTTIRKPDLGVVLNTNPVEAKLKDRSYHGIFDLCVEALSDSDKSAIEHDTIVKKSEYAAAGVKEYFILHDSDKHLAFYRLSQRQVYVPIMPQNGVIHSEVLPGFQFRMKDLRKRPDVETLLDDPAYQAFILPAWQQEREIRKTTEQRAEAEYARAEAEYARAENEAKQRRQAEAEAENEAQQRRQAEAEIARLQALLNQKPS
jgi:hypothetical protein